MAIKSNFIKNEYFYTGLSSDTKPDAPSVGSKFWETDTNIIKKFDGFTWGIDVESIPSYKDKNGNENFNAPFGEKYVAHRSPAISANFNYPTDTRKVIITQNNGATVTKDTSLLTLNSGVLSNGEAIIQSKENVRYRAAREVEIMATIRFDPPVEGNSRRFGLYSEDNGVYVGYENLEFGVSIRKNNVATFIPQSDWNGDKCDGTGRSGAIWDFTKLNIIRISFTYLGAGPISYQWYSGVSRGWITFHVHETANISNSTHIDIPYLPIRASNRNNGNTTDVKMYSGSVYTGTIDGAGSFDSSSREFSRRISKLALSAGTDTPIIIFHNKLTYQGVANRIDDQLLRVGVGVEGNKPVTITLYKLKVIPTGGTWSDVDTMNSNMEVNTTATIDLTNAEILMAWELGKSASTNDSVYDLNLLLFPDEYATFTYTSTGISDVNLSNRWSERF